MKCKIVLSIELQGAETQAGKTSCEGSATGHIWLALQRVENLPEARQHLLLRSLSYLESICQQNFYFLLGVNRAKSSSSECGGRRFSGRTAGDISQGRDCEDCTYNTGGPSKRGTRDDKGNSQQLQRPSTWPYRSRQKRSATSAGLPEDNGDDGSSDGDPHKRRRVETEKNMKFACPFFKHSPDKFIGERSCCGPGWVNVQRVKEHIFRKHRAPDFQCARCFTEFEQRSQLDGHTRSTVACEVRDRPSALPHVDEMTMQLLKQRRKSASPLTEKDKWYTVYKIIFPDDTQIPSPYYELDEKMHTKLTKGGAEEIFRDHLKETLPLDTLTDLGLIDGVMAAFSMTLSTLNGPRSTEISDDTRQSATTSTRSWPENGRYEATQSSSQIDNTAKDDPVHLWTPLSNIDSASHVPKDTEHAHIILPDLDISGFLRQVPPDNGFPVKTHDDGWDFGDGQLAFTGIFHGSELEPSFEYGYIDSEKPSSDRIGSEEQSKD